MKKRRFHRVVLFGMVLLSVGAVAGAARAFPYMSLNGNDSYTEIYQLARHWKRGSGTSGPCFGPRTMYYSMTTSGRYTDAWSTGIRNWNHSSSYTGLTIAWASSADFTLDSVYDPSQSWRGASYTPRSSYNSGGWPTCVYNKPGGYGKLNRYVLQNMSTDQLAATASHELGHILGLGHTNDCNTLMHDVASQRDACGVFGVTWAELDATRLLYYQTSSY